jgi:hypothetical protein
MACFSAQANISWKKRRWAFRRKFWQEKMLLSGRWFWKWTPNGEHIVVRWNFWTWSHTEEHLIVYAILLKLHKKAHGMLLTWVLERRKWWCEKEAEKGDGEVCILHPFGLKTAILPRLTALTNKSPHHISTFRLRHSCTFQSSFFDQSHMRSCWTFWSPTRSPHKTSSIPLFFFRYLLKCIF